MGLTDYEKYQLEWMIDHGYSLNDLLNKLAEIMNNELTVQGNPYVLLTEAIRTRILWKWNLG